MMSRRHVMIVAAAAVFSCSTRADVLFVDDDASPGGDGQSWDSAYRFLQDAIAEAASMPGVEVWVAQGRYQPDQSEKNTNGTGDREVSFVPPVTVRIEGGYAGMGAVDPDEKDPTRFITILSGDLNGDDEPGFVNRDDNSLHVVFAVGVSSALRVLTGVVIEGGNADGSAFVLAGRGGGVYTQSRLHLHDCVIRDSQASLGGGAYVAKGHQWQSCVFTGNSAGQGGGMYMKSVLFRLVRNTFSSNFASRGGGLYHTSSGGNYLIDCTFEGNAATEEGGGIYNTGTGLIRMTRCTLLRNTAGKGGAMYNAYRALITKCAFLGNSASTDGGGMYNWFSSNVLLTASVTSCEFVGNTAGAKGGGLLSGAANDAVNNCSFVGNTAGQIGGGIFAESGPIKIANCVLWGNVPDQLDGSSGVLVSVNFNNIEGGWSGPGASNIDADPAFVAEANPGADGQWGTVDDNYGDLRLRSSSPSIDAGNNWGVSADFDDLDHDNDTDELVPHDRDGNPRFVDGPADFETGCGVPAIVDIGAYEFAGEAFTEVLLADVDGDGNVGIVDFLTLLRDWGPCDPGCCLSDLDIDGQVGLADLSILIEEWT